MTFLQGYIYATFDDIREVFGNSKRGNLSQTTTEWSHITVAGYEYDISIYDWIEREGDEEEDWEPHRPIGKYWWHVGGYDRNAVTAVVKAMGLDEADYCYE